MGLMMWGGGGEGGGLRCAGCEGLVCLFKKEGSP